MYRYILKRNLTIDPRRKELLDAEWSVVDVNTKNKVGELRKSGATYVAQSESLRSTAETVDPLLALRMVFRAEHFFVEEAGQLRKITPEDLR